MLRIYFTFLSLRDTMPSESDDAQFIKSMNSMIKKNILNLDSLAKPESCFKFTDEIKYRAIELMMKVDLNDLIQAKFSPIVEAMLFIVVEAV